MDIACILNCVLWGDFCVYRAKRETNLSNFLFFPLSQVFRAVRTKLVFRKIRGNFLRQSSEEIFREKAQPRRLGLLVGFEGEGIHLGPVVETLFEGAELRPARLVFCKMNSFVKWRQENLFLLGWEHGRGIGAMSQPGITQWDRVADQVNDFHPSGKALD